MAKKPIPRKVTQRKKRGKPNPHFLATPLYQGEQHFPTQTELIEYDEAGYKIKKSEIGSNLQDEFTPAHRSWLLIKGFSEEAHINRICRSIGLHGFDIRDLLSVQQVVKVAVYEEVIFVIVSGLRTKEETDFDEIKVAFALGKDFLISFQENEDSIFDDVKKAIFENVLQLRSKSIDFLLYILFNAVNTINLNTIMQMEDELIELEEQLINAENSKDIQRILHLRRIHYTQFKRSQLALREEYSNLAQARSTLINSDNIVYFNNFDDRIRSLFGNLESYHESLISLTDVYFNNNNLMMNEIIKRLTIVSTLFIPLTFLVGVWGMNFKYMPETEWKYGYLLAWISFFVVGIGVFIFMKKKKWL